MSAAAPPLRLFIARRDDGPGAMVEYDTPWPCDICRKHAKRSLTLLTPVTKGNSRPRISAEKHPTLTLCRACILRAFRRLLRERVTQWWTQRTTRGTP